MSARWFVVGLVFVLCAARPVAADDAEIKKAAKTQAQKCQDALVKGDWDAVGRAIGDEWENRKRLAPGVTTPAIDGLIARARAAGATPLR